MDKYIITGCMVLLSLAATALAQAEGHGHGGHGGHGGQPLRHVYLDYVSPFNFVKAFSKNAQPFLLNPFRTKRSNDAPHYGNHGNQHGNQGNNNNNNYHHANNYNNIPMPNMYNNNLNNNYNRNYNNNPMIMPYSMSYNNINAMSSYRSNPFQVRNNNMFHAPMLTLPSLFSRFNVHMPRFGFGYGFPHNQHTAAAPSYMNGHNYNNQGYNNGYNGYMNNNYNNGYMNNNGYNNNYGYNADAHHQPSMHHAPSPSPSHPFGSDFMKMMGFDFGKVFQNNPSKSNFNSNYNNNNNNGHHGNSNSGHTQGKGNNYETSYSKSYSMNMDYANGKGHMVKQDSSYSNDNGKVEMQNNPAQHYSMNGNGQFVPDNSYNNQH